MSHDGSHSPVGGCCGGWAAQEDRVAVTSGLCRRKVGVKCVETYQSTEAQDSSGEEGVAGCLELFIRDDEVGK